ncbi:hypothetical protein A3D03_03525 [Candidatus Gottesmanbacteria bacterium RIFCSPHIGHO2_02_FULL_40_13]|uniref:Uncharacterized protein n=1 Tax=Candidatus Gottesmanbacteria bacterium RIFCSPHIGHO2_02_FULL_40_13 TaxID=1798384 RepID=A0A1F6A5Q8_9BACT|nr:MAG: hypothetical protein A3D03_03525 [Candidatus Gottesmanbacteria bacterium RIFCSPHIGHO2_02_FULL_40_13]
MVLRKENTLPTSGFVDIDMISLEFLNMPGLETSGSVVIDERKMSPGGLGCGYHDVTLVFDLGSQGTGSSVYKCPVSGCQTKAKIIT